MSIILDWLIYIDIDFMNKISILELYDKST